MSRVPAECRVHARPPVATDVQHATAYSLMSYVPASTPTASMQDRKRVEGEGRGGWGMTGGWVVERRERGATCLIQERRPIVNPREGGNVTIDNCAPARKPSVARPRSRDASGVSLLARDPSKSARSGKDARKSGDATAAAATQPSGAQSEDINGTEARATRCSITRRPLRASQLVLPRCTWGGLRAVDSPQKCDGHGLGSGGQALALGSIA